ncbi:hypothetical protein [Devosia naphthalenivorans]|uniref:hypothetical protein n=1 Tax=Devosia naphthalenivorans TaxID=2082392 RepID=UPI000D397858|nr:hypothetical protein [Devosia naphthalenivorans]
MDNEQLQALYQIGGAVGIVIGASIFGIRWVVMTVRAMKETPPKTEKTTIITGDTVAMDRLASTIEASSMILTENNVLRREEHADREAMRRAIEANTDATERIIAVVQDLRPEVRELTREIVRSGK